MEVVEVKHLLVVVEDDDHVLVKKSCVVHGLIGHATSDGSVTNHSHTVILAALQTHYYTEGLLPLLQHINASKMKMVITFIDECSTHVDMSIS